MTDQKSEPCASDLSVISISTRSVSGSVESAEQDKPHENMSATNNKTVKIATIQAEPVWNNLQGGVDKAISLIRQAGDDGANVLGFPEVFIPGYPWYVEGSATPVLDLHCY